MDTKPLEKFSQSARRQLHEQVAAKLERVLRTDSAELRGQVAAIDELKRQIAASSRQAVVERVAYTWFNRFCALRFMDVRGYTRMGVVSPAAGFSQPEILQEAKQGLIDADLAPFVKSQAVFDLLGGRVSSRDPQGEAYRLLLVATCNAYHEVMPFLFERIDDYTELLMPDDLLSAGSILQGVRDAMTPERCQDVEIIGWLYQFYISEKKDQVIGSKQKIKAADIPAATQLFTPHWIVRFLVENSLGRLWMLNHPNSRLAERMDYYIRDQSSVIGDQSGAATDHGSPITDYLRVNSPEELRIADPAAGSGHMLTYAFDLLDAIYEEQGYNPRDIPRLILEKNLYGMEIDERAAALAAFALTMKAREKDSRFFRRDVHPNIVILRPIQFRDEELQPLIEGMVNALFDLAKSYKEDRPHTRETLLHDLHLWAEADNFGSLLRPNLTAEQIAAVRGHLTAAATGPQVDWLAQDLRQRVLWALEQAEVLARKYHVVVANPPYMGSGNMNADLSKFAQDNYKDSKADLFAMFIERNLDLAAAYGLVAMITMQSWMFLSTYEKLRSKLLDQRTILSMAHLGPRAFDTISGEVVSTTAFVIEKAQNPSFKGSYLRLVLASTESEKEAILRANLPSDDVPLPTDYYLAAVADFKKIPGSPIAYWLGERILDGFSTGKLLGDLIPVRGGMTTADNERFVRLWHESNIRKLSLLTNAQRAKWLPYNKGGEYRKWYGNRRWVVDWENDGECIKATGRASVRSEELYLSEMVGWTDITGFSQLGVRYYGTGFLFDASGPAVFPNSRLNATSVLGYLGSKIVSIILQALNPTLHVQAGNISSLPWIYSHVGNNIHLDECVSKLIELSRSDWDSFETSWDFTDLPLLFSDFRRTTLAETYTVLRAHRWAMTLEMQRLEEENNRIFIEAYGLQDELTPEVPLSEITLTCNPYYRYDSKKSEEELEALLLADTMRELVSYAVGCMFGRYSLDKPGLILANQGETVEEYVRKVAGRAGSGERGAEDEITFMPDRDNAIPILDGDWFEDDIAGRFKTFLRVTFGEAHFAENLVFVEAALGRDIRSYFLREFYDDHLKRYKKRPIYWLFSSAQGSFNVLIYMHRYRPDTVSVVLNGYLREFQAKLRARRAHLERMSISAAASTHDKTNAIKEMDKLDKILVELTEYEDEVLYPLAAQRLEIDLDDGVKVNYAKFGAALKPVKGLNA